MDAPRIPLTCNFGSPLVRSSDNRRNKRTDLVFIALQMLFGLIMLVMILCKNNPSRPAG